MSDIELSYRTATNLPDNSSRASLQLQVSTLMIYMPAAARGTYYPVRQLHVGLPSLLDAFPYTVRTAAWQARLVVMPQKTALRLTRSQVTLKNLSFAIEYFMTRQKQPIVLSVSARGTMATLLWFFISLIKLLMSQLSGRHGLARYCLRYLH